MIKRFRRHLRTLACLAIACIFPQFAVAQAAADPPLTVEDLECRGNTSTSCEYILSHLYLMAGDRLDEEEVANARFRLSALTNFTSVRIFLEKGSERGRARVVIQVTEASPFFAESVIGLANEGSHIVGGRIGHQNLFGAGERLELSAIVRFPVDGPVERDAQYARLQYVDPTLFASPRWFFTAGVEYSNEEFVTEFEDQLRTTGVGIDITFGRRLWDFSYLSVGARYLPENEVDQLVFRDDGSIATEHISSKASLLINYGWNSEDDPYFPTQGGRFQFGAALAVENSRISDENPENNHPDVILARFVLAYRHTWSTGNGSFWTLDLGGTPGTESQDSLRATQGLTFGYAHTLPRSGLFSGIERGRWYIDGVAKSFSFSGSGGVIAEGGARAGLRFQTKSFGVVDLFLLATTEL